MEKKRKKKKKIKNEEKENTKRIFVIFLFIHSHIVIDKALFQLQSIVIFVVPAFRICTI